ncbi:MAG: serine hydrolase domain-containing protein, partial [Flavitalea sp.]
MRRAIWLFSLSLLFFNFSFSQKLIEASPESEKFSSLKLQLIDHLMKSYIDEGKMNGAATLIARNGKIIYYRAFGYDDRENRKPLKRDAIFRI